MREAIINAICEVQDDAPIGAAVDLIMQRIGAEPCPEGMQPVVIFVARDGKSLWVNDAHGELRHLGNLTNRQARAVNKS